MSAMHRVALRDVAQIERKIVDSSAIEDGTLYVGLANIQSGGCFVGVRPVDAGELRSSKFSFTPRHLLYGKLRPYLAKIARPEFEGICSTDILPVLPGPDLDRSYLAWLLLSPHMLAEASSRATGANLPRLSPTALGELKIPFPPLAEQQRIAEILDKIHALRAKRQATLAQLDKLTQSIFIHMFGDPTANPQRWPTNALEDLFEISRGGSPRPIEDYITDSPDGVNWIMIGDAPEGAKYITATKKKIRPEGVKRSRSVKPGDFLLTNSMSFGRPYIMRTSGCIHDGWLVLSPRNSNVIPDYFYSLLGSRALYTEFSRRAPGATVKNLNIGLVRSVVVPVPPEAMQREYAVRVSAIEGLTLPFQQSLGGLERLFAALQQRAFLGVL